MLLHTTVATTAATNYGNEQGPRGNSVPVRIDYALGPFYRYPSWQRPPKYILTKTHCGGTCLCANPTEYIETQRSFLIACCSGNKIMNDSKVSVTYSSDIPRLAVHLIRNPFDNIVARLHLEQKKWARTNKTEMLAQFNTSKEGFHAWCSFQDSRAFDKERISHVYDEELLGLAIQLPCHAEFMRWSWWHDLARETTRRLDIPTQQLYYENYTNNWEGTVRQLFDFLHLAPTAGADPLEFITGKHYEEYFEAIHVEIAKKIVTKLVSQETWGLLEHYFRFYLS